MIQSNGAWVFVSHSFQDWHKVRIVRNLLEKKGHKPILFFLKCVNEKKELDELIKREIKARNWFILCESENTYKSEWVKEEVSYIKKLKEQEPEYRFYKTIDLNSSISKQIQNIDEFSRKITVYISYFREDLNFARKLKTNLLEYGYDVWIDEDIKADQHWYLEIQKNLDLAINSGFVLLLISKSYLRSKSAIEKIHYTLDQKSDNIIPIIIDDKESIYRDIFLDRQTIDFSGENFTHNFHKLLFSLRNCE